MEKITFHGHQVTRWQLGDSTFLAMPELGARLMRWQIAPTGGATREVIYWPDSEQAAAFPEIHGGNPVLFPFSGRCYDKGEIFFWRDPDGTRRAIPIHGIARQSKFDVTRCDANGFTAQLLPGDESRAIYPYNFEFAVTYRFEPRRLVCEYSLHNLDTRPLPWSAGHHFYFAIPWDKNLSRGDYKIHIPAAKTLKPDYANGQLKPGPVTEQEMSLDDPRITATYHAALTNNAVTFGPKNSPGKVTVKLGADKLPPDGAIFTTWTLDDKAPYFCIEPWMGPANAPDHGIGLHKVPPGQTQIFTVEVGVE